MRDMANRQSHHVLITGGAGFIGTNLVAHLLAQTDASVTIFDNLSRPGVELNLAWLKTLAGSKRLRFVRGDVRHEERVVQAARAADEIYHLAAPSAGPELLADPRLDFDVNVTGTINVLEAARLSGKMPLVLFASTGKVYGTLDSIPLRHSPRRVEPVNAAFHGTSETTPIDVYCPYSCTKSVADQYVRDYTRHHGLPTVVFRLGCIAGPGQFGNQGQGWVAHFVYSALAGRTVTVYGDGTQVRDILHVSDLVNAVNAARAYLPVVGGKAFNIGGGIARSVSVKEMIAVIEQICHRELQCSYEPARPGDQMCYVSDNSRFSNQTSWMPRRTIEQTVRDISAFWHANRMFVMRPAEAMRRKSIVRAA